MRTSSCASVPFTLLACFVFTLGLEATWAAPQSATAKSPRGIALQPPAPNTTFTDNVVISTSLNPSLLLSQTGAPAHSWQLSGNDFNLYVLDVTAGFVPFAIFTGAPTDSLNVTSNGNVGLGVPFPENAARPLHIRRGDSPTIRLEQDNTQFAPRIWDLTANENSFALNDVTGSLTPFLVYSGAPGGSLLIDSWGNIGLGTFFPAGKLHVLSPGNQLSIFQSSDNMAVQFRLQTDSTNRRFVALNTAGVQQSQIVFGDNGAFDFLGATTAIVRMKILANGNVGIGTSSPDQTLSVNGNASKVGGGSWATFSDARLKNIKGEFKSGLDEVLKLKPVRYEYKADNAIGLKSEGEHIGFGAQEVQKIIPEAVTENSNGYLMVDNDPILWTMLNAIKEQNARVNAQNDELRARLDEKDREFGDLKKEIARLRDQITRPPTPDR